MALCSKVVGADTHFRSQSGKTTALGAIGDSIADIKPLLPS